MSSIQSYVLRFMVKRIMDWDKPLSEIRENLEKMSGKLKIPKGLSMDLDTAKKIKSEIYIPDGSISGKYLFYLHGGGFSLGMINVNRNFIMHLAKKTGIRTLVVDYRLAPEFPYPAALIDALNAYRWLIENGIQSRDIVFVGDSAGAGLCLSLLAFLRDKKISFPAAAVCLTPLTDMKGTGHSLKNLAKVDPYKMKDPLSIANYYFENENPENPLISPIYADLKGYPPILIQAAGFDVFLDDSIRFAEKAKTAKVDISIEVWDKMWHVFHMSYNLLPEAKEAVNRVCDYILDKLL